MASKTFIRFMIATIVAVVTVPSVVMAADYTVDWNLNTSYTNWAAGIDFHVGDTLTFIYKKGDHNVYKVTGPDFQKCNASASLGGPPMTSGNDLVSLTAAGMKWYICGVGDHCSRGMKLVIIVTEALAPAPAPTSGTSTTEYKYYGRTYRWFGITH